MPRKVMAICAYPGCSTLVLKGRCERHKNAGKKKRPSSHAQGYDREWRKIRAEQLFRHPMCQIQTNCDGKRATEVDHIVPLKQGGTHKPDNLQSACKRCHSAKTMREINANRYRRQTQA